MIVDGKEIIVDEVQFTGADIANIMMQTPHVVEDKEICLSLIIGTVNEFCKVHKENVHNVCDLIAESIRVCNMICEFEDVEEMKCLDV